MTGASMPRSTMTTDLVRLRAVDEKRRNAGLALRFIASSVRHAADEMKRLVEPYLECGRPLGPVSSLDYAMAHAAREKMRATPLWIAVEALERIADSDDSPGCQREARAALWRMGLLEGEPDTIPEWAE